MHEERIEAGKIRDAQQAEHQQAIEESIQKNRKSMLQAQQATAEKVTGQENVIRQREEECDRITEQLKFARAETEILKRQLQTKNTELTNAQGVITSLHEAVRSAKFSESEIRQVATRKATEFEEENRSRRTEFDQLTERLSTATKNLERSRDEAASTRKADAAAAASDVDEARRKASRQADAAMNALKKDHEQLVDRLRSEAQKDRDASALERTELRKQVEELRQNLQKVREEKIASTCRADAAEKEKGVFQQQVLSITAQYRQEKESLQQLHDVTSENHAIHTRELQNAQAKYEESLLSKEQQLHDMASARIGELEQQLNQQDYDYCHQVRRYESYVQSLQFEVQRRDEWLKEVDSDMGRQQQEYASLRQEFEHQSQEMGMLIHQRQEAIKQRVTSKTNRPEEIVYSPLSQLSKQVSAASAAKERTAFGSVLDIDGIVIRPRGNRLPKLAVDGGTPENLRYLGVQQQVPIA